MRAAHSRQQRHSQHLTDATISSTDAYILLSALRQSCQTLTHIQDATTEHAYQAVDVSGLVGTSARWKIRNQNNMSKFHRRGQEQNSNLKRLLWHPVAQKPKSKMWQIDQNPTNRLSICQWHCCKNRYSATHAPTICGLSVSWP